MVAKGDADGRPTSLLQVRSYVLCFILFWELYSQPHIFQVKSILTVLSVEINELI